MCTVRLSSNISSTGTCPAVDAFFLIVRRKCNRRTCTNIPLFLHSFSSLTQPICIEREQLQRVPHYAELFGANSAGRFLGEEGSAGDCDRAPIQARPTRRSELEKARICLVRSSQSVGDFMRGSDIINNPPIRLWNVFYRIVFVLLREDEGSLFVFRIFV